MAGAPSAKSTDNAEPTFNETPAAGEDVSISCLKIPWSPHAENNNVPDGGAAICIGTISSTIASLNTQFVVAAAMLSHDHTP